VCWIAKTGLESNMTKAVILAGGLGTRISEESHLRPKPMIEIGGRPILWHILKTYSHYGINDFVICCGYKGYIVKEYFANYFLHMSDVTFDMTKNKMEVHSNHSEPWKVTLVDTGLETGTGGRLKQVRKYLENDDYFCFTYGDGVTDLNILNTIEHHKKLGRLATVTAIQPPGRFGQLNIEGNMINHFQEKPPGDNTWRNGGYFVLSQGIFDYIDNDTTVWEQDPLQQLATDGQLSCYKHNGFWMPMDTLRDKNQLEDMLKNNKAPWVKW
jgi:glucose-1-phosphate cytidylyltransferase